EGRLWPRLQILYAPSRPRDWARRPRASVSRSWEQNRAGARNDVLERTRHLRAGRVRATLRRRHGDRGGRSRAALDAGLRALARKALRLIRCNYTRTTNYRFSDFRALIGGALRKNRRRAPPPKNARRRGALK